MTVHMRKVLFVKYQDYRKPEMDIITTLVEEDNRRYFIKEPVSSTAQMHIDRMQFFYETEKERYQQAGFKLNQCKKEKDTLYLEYIAGDSLQKTVDDCLRNNDFESAKKYFLELFRRLKSLAVTKEWEDNAVFREVFGNTAVSSCDVLTAPANIDFNLNNIIGEDWNLIDYEWSFACDVPIQYVIWRTLNNYRAHNPERTEKLITVLEDEYGIDDNIKARCQEIEYSFQRYVTEEYSLKRYTDKYKLDGWDPERDALEQDISALTEKVSNLEEQLRKKTNDNHQLQEEVLYRDSEIKRLEDRIKEIESDYQNSTSWKLTAPMRKVGGMFSKK